MSCQSKCPCVENQTDGGVCDQNGQCKCLQGFWGRKCNSPCFNGNCDITTGRPPCNGTMYGEECEIKCNCSSDGSYGSCDTYGYCHCKPKFFGPQCTKVKPDCGVFPDLPTLEKAGIKYPIHPHWFASLRYDGKYICTLVILNNYWALTLSRCFNDTYVFSKLPANKQPSDVLIHELYSVHTGDWLIANDQFNVGERIHNIEKIIPQYDDERSTSLTLVRIGESLGRSSVINDFDGSKQFSWPKEQKTGFMFDTFAQPICLDDGSTNLKKESFKSQEIGSGIQKHIQQKSKVSPALNKTVLYFRFRYGKVKTPTRFGRYPYFKLQNKGCDISNDSNSTIFCTVDRPCPNYLKDQPGASIVYSKGGKAHLLGLWFKNELMEENIGNRTINYVRDSYFDIRSSIPWIQETIA